MASGLVHSSPDVSTDSGHRVLLKTFTSRSASLYKGVQIGTGKFNAGG